MIISKSVSACSGAAALPHLPFPNSWCSPFVSDPKHPSAEQQLLPRLCYYQLHRLQMLDELEEKGFDGEWAAKP